MHAIFAALFLLLPQDGEKPPVVSSTHLPADRTLMFVELAGIETLAEHRSRIAQLAAFDSAGMQRLFDWLRSGQSPGFVELEARLRAIAEVGGAFDEGITVANLFPREGRQRGPEMCLVAAGSDARRLRGIDAKLVEALGSDKKREHLKNGTVPIGDSPVVARLAYTEQEWDQGYGNASGLAIAARGRLLAVEAFGAYGQPEQRAAMIRAVGERAGTALGVLRGETGGWRQGALPPLAAGDTFLGRFCLSWHRNLMAEGRVSERDRQEMRQLGLLGLDGLQCQLAVGADGTVRERWELQRVPGEERVFLDALKGNELGLFEVATCLPKDTLAAVRLSLDPEETTRWAYGLEGFDRLQKEEIRSFLGWLRKIIGLDPQAPDPGTAPLDAVTIALLPGAAGSPAPELALFLRIPPRENQAHDALASLLSLMAHAPWWRDPAQKLEIRAFGQGDGVVHSLRLRDLLGDSRDVEFQMLVGLLGGGYISATRVGPYFVLGCNPRTLRRLHDVSAGGESLSQRTDFAARFPKESGRMLEAFFDFPAILRSLKTIETVGFMFLGLVPEGGTLKLPPLPSGGDLAECCGVELLWSEKAANGWLVHHEGGTLLSPVAWAGVGYGVALFETWARLFR